MESAYREICRDKTGTTPDRPPFLCRRRRTTDRQDVPRAAFLYRREAACCRSPKEPDPQVLPSYPPGELARAIGLWRTHSCVPRSHSCERPYAFTAALTRDVTVYKSIGNALPRTGACPRCDVSTRLPSRACVVPVINSFVWCSLFRLSRRDARFTVSPKTVYSILSAEPTFPTTAGPV